MAGLGAWPIPWEPYGRRVVVAGPLGHVWPPWSRGRSPGFRLAAVRLWPVPWTPSGRRVVVAGFMGPVWPPWVVAGFMGPVCPPLGRGRSFDPRMAALGAWPVPWSLYGCRGGVAGPLGRVWPP